MNWNPDEIAKLVTLVAYHADTLALGEHVTDEYRDVIFKAQDTVTLVLNESGQHSVFVRTGTLNVVAQ